MADWTDGPEYAPTARPQAFVAPHTAPLTEAPAPVALAEAPVANRPQFQSPPEGAPDLRTLVPAAEPGRNPSAPFESVATPLTSEENSSADRDPHTPFATQGSALSGYLPVQPAPPSSQLNPATLGVAAPSPWPVSAPTQNSAASGPVTFSQIFRASTPTVLVSLIVAAILFPVAPIALAVASVGTSQIRYQRVALRITYLFSWILVGAFAVLIYSLAGLEFWMALCLCSVIAAWNLLVITPTIVGRALQRGESPSRP